MQDIDVPFCHLAQACRDAVVADFDYLNILARMVARRPHNSGVFAVKRIVYQHKFTFLHNLYKYKTFVHIILRVENGARFVAFGMHVFFDILFYGQCRQSISVLYEIGKCGFGGGRQEKMNRRICRHIRLTRSERLLHYNGTQTHGNQEEIPGFHVFVYACGRVFNRRF